MKLLLVSGLSQAGKTTYCKSLGKPFLQIDYIHNYKTHKTDFSQIRGDSETIILDGYTLYTDPLFEQLSQHLAGVPIDCIFIYTDLTDQYQRFCSLYLYSQLSNVYQLGRLRSLNLVYRNNGFVESSLTAFLESLIDR